MQSVSGENITFAKPLLNGDRFENPTSFTNWSGVPGVFQISKLILKETKPEKYLPEEEVLNQTLPVEKLTNFSSSSQLYASWIGHSTVLVHMEGANFITDPIWAPRAGPVFFAGAKRYRPPPLDIQQLPKLDFAVISHDHYDHLDRNAVHQIAELNPDMMWFVPLKMKEWFLYEEISNERNIVELNWGETYSFTVNNKTFSVWCLPAQHWGQRGALDRNKRLWSGWAVEGPTKKFYYTGDTGYCREEFIKIGKKFGFFDLSIIPIGCFKPNWFMKSQHIGPTEAIEIHKHVNSKYSLGIHWGTYEMGAYETYLEPRELLQELMKKETKLGTPPFETWVHGKIWSE